MSKLILTLVPLLLPLLVLAQPDKEQYSVPQDDLVYMQTSEGLIIYQLLPQVAPNHAQRFRDLVIEGWYDGLEFYRVIDGFVAQAGEGEREWNNIKGKPGKHKAELKAEFTRAMSDNFNLVQNPALLAAQTGFIDSIPAGQDPVTKEQWLLHCPGIVAMARGNDKDSASTEFYINIGQAPRHLDRNMSVFARVVLGMEVAQRMKRGELAKGGVVQDPKQRAQIVSAKLGSQLPKADRKSVSVDRFHSKRFQQRLTSARKRSHEFYTYKGNGNVDVCYYKPKVEVTARSKINRNES